MTTGLRIALVTRRFWPLTGEPETIMSTLAAALRGQGACTTIVTGQWSPDWSTLIVHRGSPVVRIPQARSSGWGAFWYMTGLSRWLRQNARRFDLVCVSRLRYDAYAAIGALRRYGTPVVLRAEEGGEAGDCRWQQKTRFGRKIQRRCLGADAIIAPSESIERELLAAGYPPDRVYTVANGVALPPDGDGRRRSAARRALAEANHDLAAADEAPIAVCVQRFHERSGLVELIDAWARIAGDWPHAQLWLIGDGPQRTALYEKIVDRGLHHQILMPGSFDELDDVFAAADLFVAPAPDGALSHSLLQALAAGLPAVAIDTRDNRQLLSGGEYGLLAPAGDSGALAAALVALLRDRVLAAKFSAAGPRRVADCWSLEQMTAGHMQLFERLAARRDAISA